MDQIKIAIPSINLNDNSIRILFDIYSQIPENAEVTFTFFKCGALSHVALAFIGGMALSVPETRRSKIKFDTVSMLQHIQDHLVSHKIITVPNSLVPAREHGPDTLPFTVYGTVTEIKYGLENIWLGDQWLHASSDVKAALASQVYELLDNALRHSGRDRCFLCGHSYKARSESGGKSQMHLCIVDFGVGISGNVKKHFAIPAAPDTACLRWALIKGNTTVGHESRGLGLGLLEEFIRLNEGSVEIYSQQAFAKITDTQSVLPVGRGFPGTMINIIYNTDGKYYRFEKSKDFPT